MANKIYIVGPVGGGKSTLARMLAKEQGLAYYEGDSVIYKPYAESTTGNHKRSDKDRESLLNEMLSSKRWVMEDSGRALFEFVWQQADSVILLEPPVGVRKRRIVLRWIKQVLRLEKCGYRPGLYMLKNMFKWTRNYENGTDTLKERLEPYQQKVTILRSEHDINRYIEENF